MGSTAYGGDEFGSGELFKEPERVIGVPDIELVQAREELTAVARAGYKEILDAEEAAGRCERLKTGEKLKEEYGIETYITCSEGEWYLHGVWEDAAAGNLPPDVLKRAEDEMLEREDSGDSVGIGDLNDGLDERLVKCRENAKNLIHKFNPAPELLFALPEQVKKRIVQEWDAAAVGLDANKDAREIKKVRMRGQFSKFFRMIPERQREYFRRSAGLEISEKNIEDEYQAIYNTRLLEEVGKEIVIGVYNSTGVEFHIETLEGLTDIAGMRDMFQLMNLVKSCKDSSSRLEVVAHSIFMENKNLAADEFIAAVPLEGDEDDEQSRRAKLWESMATDWAIFRGAKEARYNLATVLPSGQSGQAFNNLEILQKADIAAICKVVDEKGINDWKELQESLTNYYNSRESEGGDEGDQGAKSVEVMVAQSINALKDGLGPSNYNEVAMVVEFARVWINRWSKHIPGELCSDDGTPELDKVVKAIQEYGNRSVADNELAVTGPAILEEQLTEYFRDISLRAGTYMLEMGGHYTEGEDGARDSKHLQDLMWAETGVSRITEKANPELLKYEDLYRRTQEVKRGIEKLEAEESLDESDKLLLRDIGISAPFNKNKLTNELDELQLQLKKAQTAAYYAREGEVTGGVEMEEWKSVLAHPGKLGGEIDDKTFEDKVIPFYRKWIKEVKERGDRCTVQIETQALTREQWDRMEEEFAEDIAAGRFGYVSDLIHQLGEAQLRPQESPSFEYFARKIWTEDFDPELLIKQYRKVRKGNFESATGSDPDNTLSLWPVNQVHLGQSKKTPQLDGRGSNAAMGFVLDDHNPPTEFDEGSAMTRDQYKQILEATKSRNLAIAEYIQTDNKNLTEEELNFLERMKTILVKECASLGKIEDIMLEIMSKED